MGTIFRPAGLSLTVRMLQVTALSGVGQCIAVFGLLIACLARSWHVALVV
jgi:hypothetical protein